MEAPKTELMIQLYQQLGALFFLVANADKKIHKAEVKALNEIIERVWLDYDNTFDDEGKDTAWQIEDTFEQLIVRPKTKKEILADFNQFMIENPELFERVKIKLLILRTIEKIAQSYRGTNAAENKLIDEINDIFF
jgi:hypothetical protein